MIFSYQYQITSTFLTSGRSHALQVWSIPPWVDLQLITPENLPSLHTITIWHGEWWDTDLGEVWIRMLPQLHRVRIEDDYWDHFKTAAENQEEGERLLEHLEVGKIGSMSIVEEMRDSLHLWPNLKSVTISHRSQVRIDDVHQACLEIKAQRPTLRVRRVADF